MMKLGTVTADMNWFQTVDALRCLPDSHPDVYQKRTDELRRQGRDDEADLVETKFPDRFTDETRRAHEAGVDALIAWADRLVEETP